MTNQIYLKKIIKNDNKIVYEYSILGSIKKYFKDNEYFIEYPFQVNDIPDSILSVPFVANFLPFCWIFNAELKVEMIDYDFYNSIKSFGGGSLICIHR